VTLGRDVGATRRRATGPRGVRERRRQATGQGDDKQRGDATTSQLKQMDMLQLSETVSANIANIAD
jgi:hypothetical protein